MSTSIAILYGKILAGSFSECLLVQPRLVHISIQRPPCVHIYYQFCLLGVTRWRRRVFVILRTYWSQHAGYESEQKRHKIPFAPLKGQSNWLHVSINSLCLYAGPFTLHTRPNFLNYQVATFFPRPIITLGRSASMVLSTRGRRV